jgi:hypothetical protein
MTHRLNIHISPGDLVDETTLSDVGVSADDQCPRVRVDSGETRDVLSDLFEVGQGFFLTTHDRGHSRGNEAKNEETMSTGSAPQAIHRPASKPNNSPSESGLFELFAPIQTVSKLQQPDVILSDLIDQVSGRVELTESELVMVLVVEDVEEGGEEGVEVL